MTIKEGLRPGGRSARVQESVHAAVRSLLDEQERASVTVPQIATRAGVTPSTIYRRWGDLSTLLADVALAHMRPDTEPAATGNLRDDVRAWAEQYLDEMSSEPGRTMLRDMQASQTPGRCSDLITGQLQIILDRFADQPRPSIDQLLNLVVAPMAFRILFASAPLEVAELHRLIDLALSE